jgi:hypothetical protein
MKREFMLGKGICVGIELYDGAQSLMLFSKDVMV